MRRFSQICCLAICLLGISIIAAAQDKTDKSHKAEAPKTKPQPPTDLETPKDETLDLDEFFKRGEDSAKKGPSCQPPLKPAEPVA